MKVARLYRFRASHSLPGVAGYDQPHEHDYTVEVAVSQFNVPHDGFVMDTQAIDDLMEPLVGKLNGADLNDFFEPSTVEQIAYDIREHVRHTQHGYEVKVWEDNDRWGSTL